MWKPDYQGAVCERLRLAAASIRDTEFEPIPLSEQEPSVWGRLDESRQRLVRAALAISVLLDDEFPADFRTQFRDIMTQVTAGHTTSIQQGVAILPAEAVTALSNAVVELYEDTCSTWKWKDQKGD